MTAALVRLEARRMRSLVVGLIALVMGYAGVISVFFPTIRENTAVLDQFLASFPKGMLAAFGITGSLADPGSFFSTYLGSFLWPVVAAIVGVALATRPVAADLDRGYLELTLATPASRTRILAVAIAGQVAALVVLALLMIVAVLAGGAIVGAGFDASRFLAATPLEVAFAAAIAGPTTLLSVVTLSRGRSAGIVVGILLVMYLIRIVMGIDPDLAWLGRLSLFGYGDPKAIVSGGAYPVADLLVLCAIGAMGWVASLAWFRRRDLAV